MAKVHLLATDISGFDLLSSLPSQDRITAVVVPENRERTEKVQKLVESATERGLPVFSHLRSKPLPDDLPRADAALSWMYSQILPAADMTRYPLGILNMHGGKIPEFRGANVLQWAIIQGEDEIGVTWHQIVEEVDAGPIWAESRLTIPSHWSAWDVREAMLAEGIRLFSGAWRRFREGGVPLRLPDLSNGRVWPPRRPRDGRIEPGWTERKVRDTVRALCPPWPPAHVRVNEKDRAILSVESEPRADSIPYLTEEGRKIYLLLGQSLM